MAVNNLRQRVAYGLSDALLAVAPSPIISKRAPGAADLAQIGSTWIDTVLQDAYTLVAIVGNQGVWLNTAGGSSIFSSLTVNPGPTALSTVGNGAVTIGNAANTGLITIATGTGNFSLTGGGNTVGIANDAAANLVTLGSTTGAAALTLQAGTGNMALNTSATGAIAIGLATMTGSITLGQSTAGQTINIGDAVNVGAQVIDIASGAYGANSTVNILNGIGTAGTADFEVLSNSGQTGAGTINIGRGGSVGGGANAIVIGTNSGASALTLASGTGNTVMNTAVTGTITIGSAAQTGAITLGNSTAGQTISIADSAGANIVNIATQAAGSTGAVAIGNSTGNVNTGGTLTSASTITATAGNVVSNAGAVVAFTAFIFANSVQMLSGTGSPDTVVTAPKGSLFLRTDGGGVNDRAYINTDSVTAWTALVTVA